MTARVGLILQARLGSTRLPGKALAPIGSVSLLERCLNRLTVSAVGQVVLATTDAAEDDRLAAVARRMQIPVYRGSTDDVLRRYLECALTFGFDVVIRATGDNPAVDMCAPARVLSALEATSADYVCEDGLPYGAAVEAVTVSALGRAAAGAASQEDREHVTLYIKQQPGTFNVSRQLAPRSLQRPEVRVTVDTPGDLDRVRRLFASVASAEPTLPELIAASDRLARSDAA